jgi:hypothetical protein
MAPRIEVYTVLVCKVLRPEYPHTPYASGGHRSGLHYLFRRTLVVDTPGKEPSYESCATDPVVQANVSKLIAGMRTTEFALDLASLAC